MITRGPRSNLPDDDADQEYHRFLSARRSRRRLHDASGTPRGAIETSFWLGFSWISLAEMSFLRGLRGPEAKKNFLCSFPLRRRSPRRRGARIGRLAPIPFFGNLLSRLR